MLQLLRIRPYLALLVSTILIFVAFFIAATAQGVLAFDLGGSNRAVGIAQFGQGLALVVLSPLTGVLVDRLSKRLLIVTAQTVITGTMLAIAVLVLKEAISITYLAVASFINSCAFAFIGPTRTALVGELVSDGLVGRGMALLQVGNNLARIAGPLAAGLILSVSFIGVGGTYLVVALVTGLASMAMVQVPSSNDSGPLTNLGIRADILDGFSYVRANLRVFHTVANFNLTLILGSAYIVLLPGLAKETFDAGNAGVGALLAAHAIGGLTLSPLVVTQADSDRVSVLTTGSAVVFGVALLVLGFAPNFIFALAIMALLGAGSTTFQTFSYVLVGRYSDSRQLGRMMALLFIGIGISFLVGLPMGALADAFGSQVVFAGTGLGVICINLLLAVRQPGKNPSFGRKAA